MMNVQKAIYGKLLVEIAKEAKQQQIQALRDKRAKEMVKK